MLATYEAGNEDPDAFRVTSRYMIATARRAGYDASRAANPTDGTESGDASTARAPSP
jgi:hypothetical protein